MQDDRLLVGFNTGDDAAVYRLTDDLCVVQTVDFFPPIVDDAYDFGAIAAVNALSDVYAMGGKPLLALNLVCFPEDLPKSVLGRILQGGSDVAREAGIVIAGGHTVKDREPKYGMSVTGIIAPDKIVSNAGARPGDKLVLTKPIGTGIITTGAKAQVVEGDILAGAVASMRLLNRAGAEAMLAVGVSAATDITGFGLMGHLLGMMKAGNTIARVSLAAVPLLPGVRELVDKGVMPGGTRNNLHSLDSSIRWHPDLTEEDKLILCDAQTSGGLLIAVRPERLADLERELAARDTPAAVIGEVTDSAGMPDEGSPGGIFIQVTP